MPVSLVLTSDTHVPKRSRDLPRSLWTAIAEADVVLHAGDWVDVALLDEMERPAYEVEVKSGAEVERAGRSDSAGFSPS